MIAECVPTVGKLPHFLLYSESLRPAYCCLSLGPFLSHAVGALASGLSSSPSPSGRIDERLGQRLDAILSGIDDLKRTLQESRDTIRETIVKATKGITDQTILRQFEDVEGKLAGAM